MNFILMIEILSNVQVTIVACTEVNRLLPSQEDLVNIGTKTLRIKLMHHIRLKRKRVV